MTDPFERLGAELREGDGGRSGRPGPRPEFVATLRSRLERLLALADLAPPELARRAIERTPVMATTVTPYLTVHDGRRALAFYTAAFGAVEASRTTMDDGRIGHAEFRIGSTRFFLSDEFPEINVVSPATLGGTSVALHVEVDDVDGRFGVAIDAGATAQMEPADQPHGARHGTLVDPFGHRWMLSQPFERVDATSTTGGIWAALNYADAVAGIAFVTDVLGFVADLVVPDEDSTKVAHSQLRWPEGGIVQAASANRPGNVFSDRPIGTESLYVITADPRSVYDRCVAAGVEILVEPASPDYDPDGMVFSIRDPEGNIWSFGTYAGR